MTSPVPVSMVFAELENACDKGRPIVPVFGAGISVDAGIPPIQSLKVYLARIRYVVAAQQIQKDAAPPTTSELTALCQAFLHEKGWPERHELNAWYLRAAHSAPKHPIPSLAQIDQQLADDISHTTDWLTLLSAVTGEPLSSDGSGGQPTTLTLDVAYSLRDRLFDHLVQDRAPSLPHRYSAFLTELLNLRLILTTNFDTLLEDALRSETLSPTVYELRTGHPSPDADLVRGNLSVIKLHGGAYGLTADQRLNTPLDFESEVVKYVPDDALIFVLGFGGADERVMHLLRSLCSLAKPASPRLLWLFRGRSAPPKAIELASAFPDAALLSRYHDAGNFLHETYSRLATAYPASSRRYHVLSQMPSRFAWLRQFPSSEITPVGDNPNDRDQPAIVYHRDNTGFGTSSMLAEAAHDLAADHHLIWCDLEETPTVDGLVAYLQEKFRQVDPTLPPFILFRGPSSPDYVGSAEPDYRDPRVLRIVDALRRDKYIVAIDSVGEFGTSRVTDLSWASTHHAAVDEKMHDELHHELKEVVDEFRRLNLFLADLIEHSDRYGDSKIRVAYTPLDTAPATLEPQIIFEQYRLAARQHDFYALLRGRGRADCIRPVGVIDALPFCDSHTDPALESLVNRDGLRQLKERRDQLLAGGSATGDGAGHMLSDIVRLLWGNLLQPDDQALLALLATFRRPRSIVAIRNLFAPFRQETGTVFDRFRAAARRPRRAESDEVVSSHYASIERTLALFCDVRIMVRQEGGFYWMHRIARDTIYHDLWRVSPQGVADLHDMIATYYYDHIFLPSYDPAALLEYVFHRIASVRDAEPEARLVRMKDLTVRLQRHRDLLLAQTQSGMIVAWIGYIRRVELEYIWAKVQEEQNASVDQFRHQRRALRRVLCELEAELLRQSGGFVNCIMVRLCQIRDRIDEYETRDWHSQADTWKQALMSHCDALKTSSDWPRSELRRWFMDSHFCDQLRGILRQRAFVQAQESDMGRAEDGFRLIEHVLDIAVCIKSMQLEDHCRLTDSLLCEIVRVLTRLRKAVTGRSGVQFQRALIRTLFRKLDLYVGSLSPWHDAGLRAPARSDAAMIYDSAVEELRTFQGYEPGDGDRLLASVNCLWARACYVGGEYRRAYQLLNAAMSGVRPSIGANEFTSAAVCLLHHAECLMAHADARLRRASVSTGESSHTKAETLNSSRAMLDRARTALNRAEAALRCGRPNIWWINWLYVLRAQLAHERLALRSFGLFGGGEGCLRERNTEVRKEAELDLREGLLAIDAGLGNLPRSARRETELRILWGQLFVAFVAARHGPADHARGSVVAYKDGWESVCRRNIVDKSALPIRPTVDEWIRLNTETGVRESLLPEFTALCGDGELPFGEEFEQWVVPEQWDRFDALLAARGRSFHGDDFIAATCDYREFLLTLEAAVVPDAVARMPIATIDALVRGHRRRQGDVSGTSQRKRRRPDPRVKESAE